MPDVFSGSSIYGIFGDIRGVIAYPLKAASNENQIQVTSQLIWILRHAKAEDLEAHVARENVARQTREAIERLRKNEPGDVRAERRRVHDRAAGVDRACRQV